ncbi:hypothetical protein PHYSODRAFT_284860 [Phytophthora sojae]|uniref:Uncharacterized protein n=1 Tax=Phytophthora sojae (strain P6497) TaxID=1094619 RepID=G4YRY7_PHYSP|nr:hypothetical protein PHYSODRAFT_284860 [Phytophthora sojae]EGZ24124.1 hypothetical protein PHYSODRAFT_284860 [Phytophthora sojae]|eukprot:XP_009519412.1 hypothetical protein PHYSODRAFT_284860 [Phytophthora sojae]
MASDQARDPARRAPPIRAHSDSSESSSAQRRRARLGSARLTATPSPFHNLLTARQRRRTFSGTSGEFNELLNLESSTAKSVEVFRGEARGILHGIFFVLLLRFVLALVVTVGTLGVAAVLILMVKEPGASFTSYLLFY